MGDSPAKKLDFNASIIADKENLPASSPVVTATEGAADLKKPIAEIVKTHPEPPKIAEGIKAHEADEPLLQENPHRFVLFPIKYHEVRVILSTRRVGRVKWFLSTISFDTHQIQIFHANIDL